MRFRALFFVLFLLATSSTAFCEESAAGEDDRDCRRDLTAFGQRFLYRRLYISRRVNHQAFRDRRHREYQDSIERLNKDRKWILGWILELAEIIDERSKPGWFQS